MDAVAYQKDLAAWQERRQAAMIHVNGDSYPQGVGSFDNRHGYPQILGAMLGAPVLNHAVGAAVAAWSKQATRGSGGGGWADVLYDESAPLNGAAPYLSPRSASILCYGFNDEWDNNGTGTPGWTNAGPRFISAMRLIVSRHRAAAILTVTNAAMFNLGAATNFSEGASGKNGDGLLALSTIGSPATIPVTVPADIADQGGPGAAFAIYGAVAPASSGTITFAVGGQTIKTITLDPIANTAAVGSYNGWCARFPAGTPGGRAGDVITVTVTLSAGQALINGGMVEANNGLVVVQGCPHVPINPATYGWASQAQLFADIDSMNLALATLVGEFDSAVVFQDLVPVLGSAPTGTPGSPYGPDNLHPRGDGHKAIAVDTRRVIVSQNVTRDRLARGALFPPRRTEGPITRFRTVTAAAAYSMLATDQYLAFNAAIAQTANLPDANNACPSFSVNGGTAALFMLVDEGQNAAAHPKTIAAVNGQLIDGQATYTIASNGGAALLAAAGGQWWVIAAWPGLALDTVAADIQMDGVQAAGATGKAADAGHVHPTDTSRAPVTRQVIAGAGLTGGGTLAADRTLAVIFDALAADFQMDGVAAAGATGKVADAGHVHPTDTTRRPLLAAQATQTAAFNLAAGSFYPVDISAGSVPATLPNAPADGTMVEAKIVKVQASPIGSATVAGALNSLTVTCAGTDTFSDGATVQTLYAKGQAKAYRYVAATKTWYAVDTDPGSLSPWCCLGPAAVTITQSVAVQYAVDAHGRVWWRGSITNTSGATIAAATAIWSNVPAGLRPTLTEAGPQSPFITFNTAGVVSPSGAWGNGVQTWLYGFSYSTV